MNDLESFIFSQSSLQDFVDCRRRFQLRYVRRLAWPAVESEPILEAERFMQQGALFHRLVQQHLLGVPAERLEPMVAGDDLLRWWANYLELHRELAATELVPGRSFVEVNLSAALAGVRLGAQYDLIVLLPDGSARIYDWKTGPRHGRQRQARRWLAERLQTRLYPYLLVRAGAQLNGGDVLQAEKVEMIYWFAGQPNPPERFAYNLQAYRQDEAYLSELIGTVLRLGEADFPLTPDERHCAYCVYRSLCARGVRAGDLADADDDPGEAPILEVDFEQVGEIEY